MISVAEIVKKLKSTRAKEFAAKEVSTDELLSILDLSLNTANASNRQSYAMIIAGEKEKRDLALPGNKAVVYCIDFTRLKKAAQSLGKDFNYSFLSQFITAIVDVSLIVQTTVMLAREKSIDTLITNSLYYSDPEKVCGILNLPPEGVFPLLAVCFGYSNQPNGKPKKRLPISAIVHMGKYQANNGMNETDLIKYYDEANSGLINNWDTMGYQHYLDWFFEKWCPVVGTKKSSDVLEDWLKTNKFI